MSNLKLLYKILRLKGMNITQFWFKNRNKELHLTVKPHKNGCREKASQNSILRTANSGSSNRP